MGKKECAIPWCDGPGNLEVKTSSFGGIFRTIVVTVEEHLQSKRALLNGVFRCANKD